MYKRKERCFLSKIDPTVRRETVYIGVWVLVFSVLMEAVFLVLNAWDITVLLGNLLGAFAAVLNFTVSPLLFLKTTVYSESFAPFITGSGI
jgi:hypothetical protein